MNPRVQPALLKAHGWRVAAWLCLMLFGQQMQAQLAITEVMSASRENTNSGFRGPDYWELTNFGTNEVNLDGYGFRDSVTTRRLVYEPFINLVINAGESIIFFQITNAGQPVMNTADFRAWWGDVNLPAGLRCRTWRSPGLSGWEGDAVTLFDAGSNLVDSVQFGRAQLGRAFAYDPETGFFGVPSIAGVGGAFRAELSEDVGSPGTTTGTVPAHFLEPLLDQSIDIGMDVKFSVTAAGLPKPQYQWFAHGEPVTNAAGPILVISNAQPADAGEYYAVLGNGLTTATSRVASLTVNTNWRAPMIVCSPSDVTVFSHQSAVFTVIAQAVPKPSLQWSANGSDIAGAVGPTLEIVDVSEAMSGTRYGVRIWNGLGMTSTAAVLTVTPRPDLRFTEIMAWPANDEENRHFDWFELTNFDTNAVDLLGWRFSDSPSFARAFTISNHLVLEPGESGVFAARLDSRLFTAWWGADSLPPDLKFCSFGGFALENFGEALYLWNAAATSPYDVVAEVSWAAATPGVSFECEHYCYGEGCLDEASTESIVGQRGAIRATDGGDVGSPGYVANGRPRVLSVHRESGGEMSVRCRVTPDKSYRLWRTRSLWPPDWQPVQSQSATNQVLTLTDSAPPNDCGLYRLEEAE